MMKSALLLSVFIVIPGAGGVHARDQASSPAKIDVQEVVKQAIINFVTRESLPRDYTYVENLTVDHPDRKIGRTIDTFEVVEIKGHAYRRHIAHNGQKMAEHEDPENDEELRGKWLEVDHKILEEQIKPGRPKKALPPRCRKSWMNQA